MTPMNGMALRTPFEIWKQHHEFVRNYDVEGVVSMFTEDGRVEYPNAGAGMPSYLDGPTAIRAALTPLYEKARKSGRRILRYDSIVVHQTADPSIIVVEFDLIGAANGTEYSLSFIQVCTVKNGRIARLRDYLNPQVSANLQS